LQGQVLLGAVGDVFLNRREPASAFAALGSTLDRFDLLFGNCEGVYSDRPSRAPSAGLPLIQPAATARGLGAAGFSVMSCANNHFVDGGHQALADTLEALRSQGIATCGAGRDIVDARRPAVVERAGLKVAFIAYASVLPPGYRARERIPGVAPLRVATLYYPGEDYTPGAQPEIWTVPHPQDVSALRADIASARKLADVVVCSFHWGEDHRPFTLAGYEISVAQAAIDAGVDVVLAHHHHLLRGIELYRGRPIFHGLGHFVFDLPNIGDMDIGTNSMLDEIKRRSGDYAIFERPGYPSLPFHPDARFTGIGRCILTAGGVSDPGIVPCYINPDGQPELLDLGSARGREAIEYLRTANARANLRAVVEPGEEDGVPVLRVRARQSASPTPAVEISSRAVTPR